jgi:hypothetical protein
VDSCGTAVDSVWLLNRRGIRGFASKTLAGEDLTRLRLATSIIGIECSRLATTSSRLFVSLLSLYPDYRLDDTSKEPTFASSFHQPQKFRVHPYQHHFSTAKMGTLRSAKKIIHPTRVDKNNPYSHPSHPNHNPTFYSASRKSALSSTPAPAITSLRGSTDLLAEARISVGRDAVTGQRLRETRSLNELWFETPNSTAEGAHGGGLVQRARTQHEEVGGDGPEPSAYNARASTQMQKMGTRYDLLVQSLKFKRTAHPSGTPHSPSNAQSPSPHRTSQANDQHSSSDTPRTNSAPTLEPIPDSSAYITGLSRTRKSMGTRYDLFVKEMQERSKKEREERERKERQCSWYAPERAPVEYYNPRPGGGMG